MGVTAIDLHLLKEGEGHAVLGTTKILYLTCRARLLGAKLIAGKAENDQTFLRKAAVERLKAGVLRRKTATASNIDNQNNLGTDLYYSIAKELSLNFTQFKECIDSDAKKDTVTRDLQEALGKNLQGTPSFFVNDIPVDNYAYDSFKKLIDQELNK